MTTKPKNLICECGHEKGEHGCINRIYRLCLYGECNCKEFKPCEIEPEKPIMINDNLCGTCIEAEIKKEIKVVNSK